MEHFPIKAPMARVAPMVHFSFDDSPVFAAAGKITLTGPNDAVGSFRMIALADDGPVLTEVCTDVKPNGYSYAIVEGGEAFGLSHCAPCAAARPPPLLTRPQIARPSRSSR